MLNEREIAAIGFTQGHSQEILDELNTELSDQLQGCTVATQEWYAEARRFHGYVARRRSYVVTRSLAIQSLQALATQLVDDTATVHIPDLTRGLQLDISTERTTLGQDTDACLAVALAKAVFLRVPASEIIDRMMEKLPEADLAVALAVRTSVLRDWYTEVVGMPPVSRMLAMQLLGYSTELIDAEAIGRLG